MRIDLSVIDQTQFSLKEGLFRGQKATLVTPALQGTLWTQANKHLRSSIWDESGTLLSAGFPKFTNLGENPERFPAPTQFATTDYIISKLDGSLCICDWVSGFSMRTRGTFSYQTLENAADFAYCLAKYPHLSGWMHDNQDSSLLLEVTTPNQRIVIDYGPEPEFWLVGIVRKDDYSLVDQDTLDMLGIALNLKRPKRYTFNSLEECVKVVTDLKDEEGVVLYTGAKQEVLHKCKAADYLKKHRFKEHATLSNTLDLWFAQSRPDNATFRSNLLKTFDHECLSMVTVYIDQILGCWMQVQFDLLDVSSHVRDLKDLSRRDAALEIQRLYTHRGLCAAAFQTLSGRPIEDRTIRKLMEARLDEPRGESADSHLTLDTNPLPSIHPVT